jgi:hypothetical protein
MAPVKSVGHDWLSHSELKAGKPLRGEDLLPKPVPIRHCLSRFSATARRYNVGFRYLLVASILAYLVALSNP